MNLIIDIGNSAVKSAVFQDAKFLRSYVFPFENFSENFQKIKKVNLYSLNLNKSEESYNRYWEYFSETSCF